MAKNGLLAGTKRVDVFTGSTVTEVGTQVSSTNPFPVKQMNTLVTVNYDFVGVTYPTDTTEIFTFKIGGSGGTVVSVVTVTYTDSTKCDILSVSKA